MKAAFSFTILVIWLISCNFKNNHKIDLLWISFDNELLFTLPDNPQLACNNILKILDSLESLGEDSYILNINRIKCKCTLGKYDKAIKLAKQENELFFVALLKYIESNLSNAEKLFQPFIDKYSAKPYLTELELEKLLSSRIFVEGTNFDWESFIEEVYPKCINIPDYEGLLYLLEGYHESPWTYDEVKSYVCY